MKLLRMRADYFCGSTVVIALLAGCASPGQPRPPSLHLPERVGNLSAARQGPGVVLHFTVPLRTTDGELISGPVQAGLCRAVGDGPCVPTESFPGKTSATGAVEWVDVLPQALATAKERRIAYRVELFNPSGRSAGASDPAYAAGGAAPREVEDFAAEGSHAGVILRWKAEPSGSGEVLVERELLTPPVKTPRAARAPVAAKRSGRKGKHGAPVTANAATVADESVVWLHAAKGGDSGGMIDAAAHPDEAYRYRAVRSRHVTVDGLNLEVRSVASAAVTFTLHDVFPPAVPQGLTAAASPVEGQPGLSVDLVWRPGTESDLAGYNVYRLSISADGTVGPVVKLTEKPAGLPAFRDTSAVRGVGYRYTVTAVDGKDNESAASEPAEVSATP